MVNGIVTLFLAAFVVLAVFGVVASLLILSVWRADPYHFALWSAALRRKLDDRNRSTPQSAGPAWPRALNLRARSFGGVRSEAVSRPVPPLATSPPVIAPGRSAAARLQYWLELAR
jgi:hypothetical protein